MGLYRKYMNHYNPFLFNTLFMNGIIPPLSPFRKGGYERIEEKGIRED